MNWCDPKSMWQQGMKTRRRRLFILSFAVPIAVGAPFIVPALLTRAGPLTMGDFVSVPMIVAGLFVVIAVCWAIRTAMRDAVLVDLVPKYEGRVCRKCARPVEEVDGGSLRCPKCLRRYAESELLDKWRRYGISPIAPYRWLLGQNREVVIEDGSIRIDLEGRRMKRGLLYGLPFVLLLLAFPLLFSSASGDWLRHGQYFMPAVFMWIGMAIGYGFAWRVVDLDRRFCTICRYERDSSAGELCPECGARWMESGGTMAGRIQMRKPAVFAAGFMLVLAAAGFVNMFTGADLVQRVTPTATILNRIVSSDDAANFMHWRDLTSRTLTQEQRDSLARRLLEKRREPGASIMDNQWLASEFAAGAMSAANQDEYFRTMLDIKLIAPEQVRVGETFEVTTQVIDRFSEAASQFPAAIVSGYFVGDDSSPRHRPTIAVPGTLLGHERLMNGKPAAANAFSPLEPLQLAADEPGEMRVRLELWLIAADSSGETSFVPQWNEDGTPVLPEPRHWDEHIVIERIIEVVE